MLKSESYHIVSPKGRHKKWRIRHVQNFQDGTRRQTYFKSDTLDKINTDFLSGSLHHNQALELVQDYLHKLKKSKNGQTEISDENRRIFKNFWQEKYEYRREIKESSRATAHAQFKKALEIIGDLNLHIVEQKEIYKRFKRAKIKPKMKKEYGMRLNQLFKFLKRDIHLKFQREEINQISYLTEAEFQKLHNHLPNDFKLPAKILFYTGLRIGELLGLEHEHYDENLSTLSIVQQFTRSGNYELPKNRKKRKVPVPLRD